MFQFAISMKYFWPLLRDTTIFLFLAIFGSWFVLEENNEKKRTFTILNILWFAYLIFIFVLILGYEQAYRTILYNPLPILTAYSIQKAVSFISVKAQSYTKNNVRTPIRILVNRRKETLGSLFIVFGLLLGSAAVSNSYIVEYKFYNRTYYEKLLLVREYFGFNNKTIEVIIHQDKWHEVSPYLAYAVIGENVYFGTIDDFLDYLNKEEQLFRDLKYLVLVKDLVNLKIEKKYLTHACMLGTQIYIIPLEDILE